LDTIDLGFMRPRSGEEWQLAYCQAQLYVEYIEKTYGVAAIGGLLAAYADGLDTASALQKVCKVTKGDFERGYREYLQKVVASLRGRPAEKAMTYRELQAAHEKNPGDLDLAARLADMSLRRNKAEARKLADSVLQKKKDHALAAYVKAMLLRAAGDDESALQLLEVAATADPPEPKALLILGKVYFDGAKFDQAAALFERARKSQPHDARWLNELVRVYAQSGDKDKLIGVLKDLAPTDADDLDARRRLARLLLERNQPEQAEKYAREALEIDVLDAEAEEMLGDAFAAQKKHAAAIEPFEVAAAQWEAKRRPERVDDIRLKLARAYQATGTKDKALAEITKLLERDPRNAEALAIKKELEK
ncbi:MAG: tetratricopeptide repeat protein, partial [Gemmataceae bacterium]